MQYTIKPASERKRYNDGATDSQQIYELAKALIKVLEDHRVLDIAQGYVSNIDGTNMNSVFIHAHAVLQKHDLVLIHGSTN